MSQDHFAANLNESPTGEGMTDLNQQIDDKETGFQAAAGAENPSQKRSIPLWLVLVGVMATLLAGGIGYTKLFGSSRSPQAVSRSTFTAFEQDSGMMAAPTPVPHLPMPPTSHETVNENTSLLAPQPAKSDATLLAAPTLPAEPLPSTPREASSSISSPDAASVPHEDAPMALVQLAINTQNAQIAQLEKELSALRTRLAARPLAAYPVKAPARPQIQRGFHIKQIIPGQGWVEDEATGKQTIVRVGDKLGEANVLKIDVNHYTITTTAGVIQ